MRMMRTGGANWHVVASGLNWRAGTVGPDWCAGATCYVAQLPSPNQAGVALERNVLQCIGGNSLAFDGGGTVFVMTFGGGIVCVSLCECS